MSTDVQMASGVVSFNGPGIVPQILRYSASIAGFMGLLVVLFMVVKVVEHYQRRRNLRADANANRLLQPVGDRGLLIDGREAADRRLGFTAEQMAELGDSWKFHEEAEAHVSGDDEEAQGWRKECIVCLGDYVEGELLRKLHKCDHFFHQECVDAWLLTHRTCPLCRISLSTVTQTPEDGHLESSHVAGTQPENSPVPDGAGTQPQNSPVPDGAPPGEIDPEQDPGRLPAGEDAGADADSVSRASPEASSLCNNQLDLQPESTQHIQSTRMNSTSGSHECSVVAGSGRAAAHETRVLVEEGVHADDIPLSAGRLQDDELLKESKEVRVDIAERR